MIIQACINKFYNSDLTNSCHFFLDQLKLHVLDFNSYKQEVNFTHNYIFEVIPDR